MAVLCQLSIEIPRIARQPRMLGSSCPDPVTALRPLSGEILSSHPPCLQSVSSWVRYTVFVLQITSRCIVAEYVRCPSSKHVTPLYSPVSAKSTLGLSPFPHGTNNQSVLYPAIVQKCSSESIALPLKVHLVKGTVGRVLRVQTQW